MNTRSPLPLMVLMVAVVSQAGAQVNVEELRSFDVDGMAVSISGDVALLSGNTEAVSLGGRGRFDFRKGKRYTFFVGTVRYSENQGQAYQERWFGHVRYNYDLRPWLVGEVFGQAEHDGITLLQVRLVAGSGLRVRYIRREQSRLRLFQGMSLMYEYEDLDAAHVGDHPARMHVGRWSNYLNLHLMLSETARLMHTVYVQPRLDALSDLRLLEEATLAFAVTKHLSVRTTFNLRYDSRPPGDVGTLDLALRNGLTVTF